MYVLVEYVCSLWALQGSDLTRLKLCTFHSSELPGAGVHLALTCLKYFQCLCQWKAQFLLCVRPVRADSSTLQKGSNLCVRNIVEFNRINNYWNISFACRKMFQEVIFCIIAYSCVWIVFFLLQKNITVICYCKRITL